MNKQDHVQHPATGHLIVILLLTCLLSLLSIKADAKEKGKKIKPTTPAHQLTYQFHGISDEDMEENITWQLRSAEPAADKLTPETIKTFYQTMPSVIAKATQAHGYFNAVATGKLQHKNSLFTKITEWQAIFKVNLGRPILITNVNLQLTGPGQQNKKLREYVANYPMKTKQVLNSPKYDSAKQKLFDIAYEQGYLDALTHQSIVEVDQDAYQATINIHFDSGPQYYMGDVTFEQENFSESYLRRFIPFYSGAPYSPELLLKMQRDLVASGDFESVQVFTDKDNAEKNIVPIHVTLTARKRNRYTFGVGYGTDTDFRGTAAWERRRVNKRGHRFNATVQASGLQQIVQGKYTIPGHHPATDNYNLNAGYQQSQVDTGDRETEFVSIDYSKQFRVYWQRIIALTFIHENFESVEKGIKQPERTKQLLMPSLTYAKIKKDDPIKPTKGQRARIDLRAAYRDLSSSTSFFQVHLQGKVLMMPTKNMRWIGRGELGYTAVERFNELPLSQRFETGGPQSIRGYDLAAIGPGRYLEVLGLEHQQRVRGDWFLGGFFDIGNASNDLMSELKKSAGLSLSWLSPIGTISISVAKPLDRLKPGDKKKWTFQFNLGPDI